MLFNLRKCMESKIQDRDYRKERQIDEFGRLCYERARPANELVGAVAGECVGRVVTPVSDS